MRSPTAVILVALSCSSTARGVHTGTGDQRPTGELAAQLTLPASPDGSAALAELDTRAEQGDTEAAWLRAHYLLDLFDDARFRDDEASRAALASAMAVEPASLRGDEATGRALDFLAVEVDRVLRLDRLHRDAVSARALVSGDQKPPTDRDAVYSHTAALRSLSRGGGALAGNATLRLIDHCQQALQHAADAPIAQQSRSVSHCLYPLFDADPDPYFAEDPALRPPFPRWQDLVAAADELSRSVPAPGRLAEALAAQRAALDRFARERGGRLPTALDPVALALPPMDSAPPYDFAPRIELGDGAAVGPAEKYAEALRVPVAGDGRGAVALVMAAHAPAPATATAARAATLAGAHELRLAVATTQTLTVPPGDYWAPRLVDNTVARVGVLPLSLAPLGASAPDHGPRARAWDPSRASLGLHLVVGERQWQLIAPDGPVVSISSSTADDDPSSVLRAALAEIRSAFPDEDGLVLVPAAGASYGALVAAAAASARRADGTPLFSRLAIAPSAPTPRGNKLAQRIHRRAAAAVTIEPATLVGRTPIARRCYQALLERSPRLAGRFRFELRAGAAAMVEGPGHKGLRQCATETLASAMAAADAAAAEIQFAVTP